MSTPAPTSPVTGQCAANNWLIHLVNTLPTIIIPLAGLFAHATVTNTLANANATTTTTTAQADAAALTAQAQALASREFKGKPLKKTRGGWFRKKE